ncbi:MAG TPA: CHAD domain-containing protein, partial [Planctomycetota bacterium]|nr:CHAD domain-containing protein [Planctomycetota bacterium]
MSEDHELLLAKPARDAVRTLLRHRLKAASRAAARLGDPADLAALHGFRTAVRRFRTLERAFRPWAPGRLKGGPLRRLKAVVAATNPARDAQAQAAILDDVARSAAPSERRAIDDFVGVRRELARRTVEDARLAVTAAWPDVEARLRRALRKRRSPRPWDAPPSTFAAAAASAARTAATRLRLLLAEAARSDDAGSVHAARIAAKRLRYILEACVAEAPGVAEAADRARSLQDALGLLRDRQLLLAGFDGAQSREENGAAAASLRATLRPAVGDAFDAFKALADVRSPSPSAVAAALLGRRDASDDASVECERKFLLSRVPPETNGAPWYRVDQGWLPGLRLKERIRRTRTPDGRARYWRTVKSG